MTNLSAPDPSGPHPKWYYRLLPDHSTAPCDLMTWAREFEDRGREVAFDRVGDTHVSTVFLGLDHNFGSGEPLLFETMIFGGPLDEYTWRYETWEQAEEGHRAAVRLAQAADE